MRPKNAKAGDTAPPPQPTENVVAICDVNGENLDRAAAAFKGARAFRDFRKLYDTIKESEIDGVVVSTTEHTHAYATMPALKMKKPVYCEKPLTRDVAEARLITQAAAEAGVATQMGTQIHGMPNYRRVVELIQSGAIGKVTEAHVCVSRAWGLQARKKLRRTKMSSLSRSVPRKSRHRHRISIGICGWGRRPTAPTTKSIFPDPSGIAGGTSATARCRISAVIGMICHSGP